MKLRTRSHGPKRGATGEPLAVQVGGARAVAFAWYTPETWAELRATADDPEALDESYEAWLASAEDALQSLQSRGVPAKRFPLDVAAAAAWSRKEGRRFDSAARAAYVAAVRPKGPRT
jgi:hypothetical protein